MARDAYFIIRVYVHGMMSMMTTKVVYRNTSILEYRYQCAE